MTRNVICSFLAALLLILCGCAARDPIAKPLVPSWEKPEAADSGVQAVGGEPADAANTAEKSPEEAPAPTRRLDVDYNARGHADEAPDAAEPEAADAADEAAKAEAGAEAPAEDSAAEPELLAGNGRVIVIDPGHQAKGNYELEALGPGSSETKIKVSAGTASCNTGEPESKLVLAISLKLQTELEARGYTVIMTRTTEDVDLSNIDRATVANDANADALLRIHANGSESASMDGAMTLCQTAGSPFNADIYLQSYALSSIVLDELCAAAGCRKLYVWETDTMSGINWSRVPVTIVEVGFMTNPAEDALMATDEYQDKLVIGIANGVDRYFREQEAQSAQ